LLRGPIAGFPKFRGQKVKMCLLAETSPLLVGEPCDLLHPDSTGDLKICNSSNHGRYSPAKAGLIRGKLRVFIRRRQRT